MTTVVRKRQLLRAHSKLVVVRRQGMMRQHHTAVPPARTHKRVVFLSEHCVYARACLLIDNRLSGRTAVVSGVSMISPSTGRLRASATRATCSATARSSSLP
jgi:hypothetical protein